jgi:pyruvate-formate lyase-activating enzyme
MLTNYKNYGRLWRVYGRSALLRSTPRRVINALRTEWAYRRRIVDVRSHPYVLFIEPLYYCNLKCPLCPRETSPDARRGAEAGRLGDGLIDRVFDELGNYLYQCHIFGNGEPMLDWPRTKAIIKAARRMRIFTLVSTNCTILTPELARDVVTSGLDYLVCAVDGMSQASYERYRVGGDCAVAHANMKLLTDAKRETGSGITIEWQFLVHRHNSHEVIDAHKRARELGIYFRPSPLGGIDDESLAAEWLPNDTWRDNAPTGQPKRDFPCYWLWRAIVVNSNGQLGRCPGHSNVHQLGSFKERSLLEIYHGPATRRARELFRRGPVSDGDFPVPCVTCDQFERHHGPRKSTSISNSGSGAVSLRILDDRPTNEQAPKAPSVADIRR